MSSHERSTPGRFSIRKVGIVLLVLALAAGAGCTSVLDSGGSGSANLVENVPADQNVLIEADMAVLQDDTTRQLLEQGGDETEDAPSEAEMEAGFSYVEAETGLDPREINRVLLFGQTDEVSDVQNPTQAAGGNERVGILVSTDWSQADLTAAFENASESSITQASYESQEGVLYRVADSGNDGDPSYLGVLGGGNFVLGDETSVRASLDTQYAGADSLSGDLLEAYESTRDGHATVAVLVPEEDRSTQFGQMRAMTGVYYTDGSTVGLEGRIVTDSEESASNINSGLQFALTGMANDPQTQQLMQDLDISQDGTDVTFTYESDVETLIDAADAA